MKENEDKEARRKRNPGNLYGLLLNFTKPRLEIKRVIYQNDYNKISKTV
jgi:hypothetical protein